jgi:hypothetical protein
MVAPKGMREWIRGGEKEGLAWSKTTFQEHRRLVQVQVSADAIASNIASVVSSCKPRLVRNNAIEWQCVLVLLLLLVVLC